MLSLYPKLSPSPHLSHPPSPLNMVAKMILLAVSASAALASASARR